MKLIHLLGACFVVASFSKLSAQEVIFSAQKTFPKGLVSIFPNASNNSQTNGNYFVVTGSDWSFNLLGSPKKKGEKEIKPEISYYENNVFTSKSKLTLDTQNGKASLMGMSALDDVSIVLLRQSNEGYNRCYYQFYDKTCKAVSEPVLLSEKKFKEGFISFFTAIISENQQFISLQYVELNSKGAGDGVVSFETFDRSFKLIDHGDYSSLDIQPQDFLLKSLVTNDGSFLIGCGQVAVNDKGKATSEFEKFKVHIQKSGNKSIWEFKIPCTKVSEVEMFLSDKNDRILYLAGMGFEAGSRDSKVAFYAKYDLDSGKELSNVKNTINFETFMYQPQKVFEQNDGVVFVTERVFGGASTTMSVGGGAVSTTPKDYFNTVLCFKVEAGSKTVPWNTIIDKEQVFISSLGLSQFGSIKVINSDKHCFIFFNDPTANYNEQGDYIATEKNFDKFDGKQEKKLWLDDKGVAMVKLDLSDGSTQRRLIVRNKGIIDLSDKCFVTAPNGHFAAFLIQKNELGQIGLIEF